MSEQQAYEGSVYESEINKEIGGETLTYEEYRQLCDGSTNNFRKIGLQEQRFYEQAVSDPSTVMATLDGKKVPVLADLKYEKMYEAERCAQMLEGRNLKLLSLPVSLFESPALLFEEPVPVPERGLGIIVEAFDEEGAKDVNREVPKMPFTDGAQAQVHEFVNPLLENMPGHETAWMASYRYTLLPQRTELKRYHDQGAAAKEVMTAWRSYCLESNAEELPGEKPDGTFLLSSDQLAARPDIIDSLWAISEVGFGRILGAHHPVSMEFNREFFDSQIIAKDTLTAIYYDEGEPVCFGFVGTGMHSNEWLNCDSDVIRQELEEAKGAEQLYVHFYELISNGHKGMGYSTKILAAFYELADRTGYETSVFFESTNLSATYIPAILEKEADQSAAVTMSQRVKMLGKLHYYALTVDPVDSDAAETHGGVSV